MKRSHLRFALLFLLLMILPLAACDEELPHEHLFGEWCVTIPPTHTEAGEELRGCVNCAYKETRTVEPLGHTFAASWDYDASSHWHTCSCGATHDVALHEPDEAGVCLHCHVDLSRLHYTKAGGVITFGSYPQSQVTDEALVASLDRVVEALPTAEDKGGWELYDDLEGAAEEPYMWYIDIEHEGARYRGVYFTDYRPMRNSMPTGADYSMQDENGYARGSVFWFRFDPIRWRILSEREGRAFLSAELVLDATPYQDSIVDSNYSTVGIEDNAPTGTQANAYLYSRVRHFLTTTFVDLAFTDEERAMLLGTTLRNDRSLPSSDGTGDKVFLLGTGDLSTRSGDAAWMRLASDYAACRGASRMQNENLYDGGAPWYLRAPSYLSDLLDTSSEKRMKTRMVSSTGNYRYDTIITDVDLTCVGTVPAVWIDLAEVEEVK